MAELVFARSPWLPSVERVGGGLRLALAAGADALQGPRIFTVPIEDRHFEVIRRDLARHLVLCCALLPLCDSAGIRGEIDEAAAVGLLDPILLGSPADVDALVAQRGLRLSMLVGHGAEVSLLERGEVLASLRGAVADSDPLLSQRWEADRERRARAVELTPLDEAVLLYTGQLLHSSTRPGRHPELVDPAFRGPVLDVIASAESARDGVRPASWKRITGAVTAQLATSHPDLAVDTVVSVAWLMSGESALDRPGQ